MAPVAACAGDDPTLGSTDSLSSRDVLGVNIDALGGPGSASVADLGATWVRMELVDDSPGPALSPEVEGRLDAALSDYHSRGIRVLLLVDYGTSPGYPGWSECGPGGDFDGWKASYLARVGWVAGHFGNRIDAWEVWNEPDFPLPACGEATYDPSIPAEVYGPLLRAAHDAIRGAGAGGTIVMGGLESGQTAYVTGAAQAAGGLAADAVGVHPYGVVPDPSFCGTDGLVCEWGTLEGIIDRFQGASGLPVWFTELGINTTDPAHQADYLAAAYREVDRAGDKAGPALYFDWSDAMVAPFGLTDASGAPKPYAYERYQSLARDAGGGGGGGGGGGSPWGLASRMHGAVVAAGARVAGISVSVWGHDQGDFHTTTTDALGIYSFDGLDRASQYNLTVNAQFDAGHYDAIDPAHDTLVRNNVVLDAGPDGWHGEEVELAY